MSEQANKLLKNELENREDGLFWDDAVALVADKCDVKPNTAETYIRRSDKATTETRADGNKYVVSPRATIDETTFDEEHVLKMEVGDRTSDRFASLPILEDVGHPLVPEGHEKGYFRRKVAGKESDINVVTAAMADPDYSVLLEGEAGVGKDRLILHIAAKTNRPVVRVAASSNEDLVEILIGHYSASEDGGFEFRKGLATIAVEYGYILIIDEFNMLDGKTQARLNQLLEDADQAKLTIPETNEVIEPHDEFIFVATQNPRKVGYGGVESLNMATKSRFYPVEIPALEPTAERNVIANESNWDADARELDNLLGRGGVIPSLRNLYEIGKISVWVSTRDVIKIARMAESIGNVRTASEIVLVGLADPEDKEPIRSAINDRNW